MIQEAAYPSAVLLPEFAPGATLDNQKLFVHRLIESGVPFIHGFACDSWFARETSPPGGFGGVGKINSNSSRSSRSLISARSPKDLAHPAEITGAD